MTEWIWLNGQIKPLAEATVSVEDRGFQFADGVYEVIRLYAGRPFMLTEHMERLAKSCAGIKLPTPAECAAVWTTRTLEDEIRALIAKSQIVEGMVYLQITRGVAPRNHAFPTGRPTLLFYARQLPPLDPPGKAPGVKLISLPDNRWTGCWMKTIALLPNILAKNQVLAAGADEGVFIHSENVTECCASNLFLVLAGRLTTHPVGEKVLPGITRLALLDIAKKLNIPADERSVPQADAMAAEEVFITSTTREIGWVSQWDARSFGDHCGPVTLRLHQALHERAVASC